MKFVLVSKARFLHTCQTPTTEKSGTELRGTLGIDPVTGKWDGKVEMLPASLVRLPSDFSMDLLAISPL